MKLKSQEEDMTKDKERFLKMCEAVYDVQVNTDRVVFLTFSGHVNSFDLSVGLSKERYNEKAMSSHFVYLNDNYDREIEELLGFLDESRIKYVEANDLKIHDIGKTFFAKKGEDSFMKVRLDGITINGYSSGNDVYAQLYREVVQ